MVPRTRARQGWGGPPGDALRSRAAGRRGFDLDREDVKKYPRLDVFQRVAGR
jgi:hypothetical protein